MTEPHPRELTEGDYAVRPTLAASLASLFPHKQLTRLRSLCLARSQGALDSLTHGPDEEPKELDIHTPAEHGECRPQALRQAGG